MTTIQYHVMLIGGHVVAEVKWPAFGSELQDAFFIGGLSSLYP